MSGIDLRAFVASLSHDEVLALKNAIIAKNSVSNECKPPVVQHEIREIADLRCPEHNKKFISFCCDCNVPICSKCLERCLSHQMKSLNEIKVMRPRILRAKVSALVSCVPNIISHFEEEIKKLNEKHEELLTTIHNWQLMFSNKEKTMENERRIIEQMKKLLKKLTPECITETLKDIAKRHMADLDCYNKIEEEFASIEKRRLELLVDKTDIEKKINEHKIIVSLLDIMGAIEPENPEILVEDSKLTDLQMFSIGVCFKYAVMYGSDDSLKNILVDCALDLDFVVQTFNEELKYYEGIGISNPISCKIPFNRDAAITAGISSQGILACHSNSGSNLFLYDLKTKNFVNIGEITGYATSAFYEDKLFLFINGKTEVLHAKTADLFKKPSITTFEKFPYNGCQCQCDASRSELIGRVYYGANDKILHEFDLKNMTFVSLSVPNITSVYANTGIEMGDYKCICTTTNNVTIAVKNDNSTKAIKNTTSYANVFIPSSGNPSNVDDGVIFDTSNMYYKDIKHKLDNPIKPRCYQSILRIIDDVFIVYDEGKKDWVCVRIVVP